MKTLQGNFLLTATIKFKKQTAAISSTPVKEQMPGFYGRICLLYPYYTLHSSHILSVPWSPLQPSSFRENSARKKKKRLAYEHELFPFQSQGTVAPITQQGLWFYLSQGCTPHQTGCKSSCNPYLTLLLLSQLSIGKGSDKKISSQPTATVPDH